MNHADLLIRHSKHSVRSGRDLTFLLSNDTFVTKISKNREQTFLEILFVCSVFYVKVVIVTSAHELLSKTFIHVCFDILNQL